MLTGMAFCDGVPERSICCTVEPEYLSRIDDYKIYCSSMMSEIAFASITGAKTFPESISSSIFINDANTKPIFNGVVKVQNFLTTHFVGRAPLTWYGPKTPAGTQFFLFCENGFTDYKWRKFGTDGGGRGDNANANDMYTYQR